MTSHDADSALEPARTPRTFGKTALSHQEVDALIAGELYEAQQVLTYAAFRIPTGTYTGEQWRALAETLDDLAELTPYVRQRCVRRVTAH